MKISQEDRDKYIKFWNKIKGKIFIFEDKAAPKYAPRIYSIPDTLENILYRQTINILTLVECCKVNTDDAIPSKELVANLIDRLKIKFLDKVESTDILSR